MLFYYKDNRKIFYYNNSKAKIGEIHTWSDGSEHKKTSVGYDKR